jgi:hypothetical protein
MTVTLTLKLCSPTRLFNSMVNVLFLKLDGSCMGAHYFIPFTFYVYKYFIMHFQTNVIKAGQFNG